nr:RIPOR family member 3 isoform X3 [Oryctolagus cuniculus]
MSVRVRFLSPGDAAAVGAVGRSASFAGLSSAQRRRIAKGSSRSSVRSRTPVRASRAYGTLRKGSVCLDPKPQQVKRIFEALKRGLKEHLCLQQAELDYLCGRHTDTRRNSRLAFYYDLDKHTRSVERHIRKMEFHISKVDELYEGYCIQCRLREGASAMQRAFSRCPPSRASRESLQELGRSLHQCTEDMWVIEGALELHLGDFHVRMKGLVGYARLCPGDQYEVLMRLGRQRWKLKGRIESDDSQTWDEEEKTFVPTLHENLEIKVTELRGLSSLTVGAVTCDIVDFFCTRPQLVVVDVTELGTIKLQLEVQWSPLDSESLLVSPSLPAKASVGSRKGSLYTWTPPSTPSFRERYCLSVLQPSLSARPRPPSILSFPSDSDLRGPGSWGRSQELPEMDSFSSEDPRDTETSTSASTSDVGFLPLAIGTPASVQEEGPPPPGLHLEQLDWRNLGGDSPDLPWGSPDHPGTAPCRQEGRAEGEAGVGDEGPGLALAEPLQEVLALLSAVGPAQPQLRELERQVLGFQDRLKPRGGRREEHASDESLTKYILDSFAFLNSHFASEQLSLAAGSRGPRDRTSPPPSPPLSQELTAGAPELDELLAVHLRVCRAVLQKLAAPHVPRLVQERLLEEAAQQKRVLETLSVLDFEKAGRAASIEESRVQEGEPGAVEGVHGARRGAVLPRHGAAEPAQEDVPAPRPGEAPGTAGDSVPQAPGAGAQLQRAAPGGRAPRRTDGHLVPVPQLPAEAQRLRPGGPLGPAHQGSHTHRGAARWRTAQGRQEAAGEAAEPAPAPAPDPGSLGAAPAGRAPAGVQGGQCAPGRCSLQLQLPGEGSVLLQPRPGRG